MQGGLTATQVVNRRTTASAGVAVSHQFGTLESPYRRARVVSSLFPEDLPGRRTRTTAFVGLSVFLGWSTALHTRLGAYADDWGVLGIAPELALARQRGEDHLVHLRYRLYEQSRADFYDVAYASLSSYRTGDARLGRIVEHEVAADASLTLWGERLARRNVSLVLGYAFLTLEHSDLERHTLAHVVSGGLSGAY